MATTTTVIPTAEVVVQVVAVIDGTKVVTTAEVVAQVVDVVDVVFDVRIRSQSGSQRAVVAVVQVVTSRDTVKGVTNPGTTGVTSRVAVSVVQVTVVNAVLVLLVAEVLLAVLEAVGVTVSVIITGNATADDDDGA